MEILRSAGIWSVPMALLIFIFVFVSGIIGEEDISNESIRKSLAQISRQLMMQQLFVEERIRSEGDSGIKVTRLTAVGPRPYIAETHSSSSQVKIYILTQQRICTTSFMYGKVQCNYCEEFKNETIVYLCIPTLHPPIPLHHLFSFLKAERQHCMYRRGGCFSTACCHWEISF